MDQIKGQWSPEEDEMLTNLFLEHGFNWSLISKSIPGKSVETRLSRLLSLLVKDGLTDLTAGRRWSPEEDEMLLNLFEKHGSNWSLISKSIQGKSPAKCWSRWQTLAKNDPDQIERHEDITIGGQGSSYIHHGNLSHELGGVSHQPPSISDFLRDNMFSRGMHSYSSYQSAPSWDALYKRESSPSWNALNKRESSLMMIKGHDDVQEKGHNKES